MDAPRHLGRLALSAAIACAPHLAAGEPFACADGSFSVMAEAPAAAALACRLAAEVKPRIEACGLTQARPIRIELVAHLDHGFGLCLGAYDCAADVIRITDPAHVPASVGEEGAYARLPAEVVFKALLAHELAHALLEQSSPGVDLAFVDHEYVAAVMELETMAPAWREVYIAAAPVGLPPRVGLISALIYGFEPRKFAVNAWQFFRAEPDGCDRIRRIAAGTFTFADLPR
jgi:hypothetical protein